MSLLLGPGITCLSSTDQLSSHHVAFVENGEKQEHSFNLFHK